MTPASSAATWGADVLAGYSQRTLALGPDPDGEGEIFATLVRRGPAAPAKHAVLLTHGYTDYFFNTELADHFADRQFAFYALDLHKCGRSWREGQTPHFTTDLKRYDRELDWALDTVAADAADPHVLVVAHSAGGLIVSLWLHRRHQAGRLGRVSGLVLNSPWLDLQGPSILRTPVTSAALGAMSRMRKLSVVRKTGDFGYGSSLHRDHGGEFDYNLAWKPLGGFPVTVGWIHAIRRGHAQLHRGLDIGVPSLVLRSDHTIPETRNPAAMERGDAVLDVRQIARWAGCLGNRTTVVPIADAKHDVFLSLAEPRRAAYTELDAWLDWYARSVDTPAPAKAGR